MDQEPTRIEGGNYFVEVLQGADSAEPFWYYVVQRHESPEIVDLAKFKTFAEAIEGAKRALARLNRATAAE